MDGLDILMVWRRFRKWFAIALIVGLAVKSPTAMAVFTGLVERETERVAAILTAALEALFTEITASS